MTKIKSKLVQFKVPESDYVLYEKASSLDGRRLTDFMRYYLKMSAESIVAVRGQKQILKLFSDEKVVKKMLEDMSKST